MKISERITLTRKFSFFILAIFTGSYSDGQKIETVYLNAKDSTSNLYIIAYPPKLPWKGYLFLIPGGFQKARDVLTQQICFLIILYHA